MPIGDLSVSSMLDMLSSIQKQGFVPSGDPAAAGGAPPPGGAMPPGMDPAAAGGAMPPGGDPMGGAAGGIAPPDPSALGMPPPGPDPSTMVAPDGSSPMPPGGGGSGGGAGGGIKIKPEDIVVLQQQGARMLGEMKMIRDLILDLFKQMNFNVSPDTLRGAAGSMGDIVDPQASNQMGMTNGGM